MSSWASDGGAFSHEFYAKSVVNIEKMTGSMRVVVFGNGSRALSIIVRELLVAIIGLDKAVWVETMMQDQFIMGSLGPSLIQH